MTIKTAYQSIKVLFERNQAFAVPKYQREYAWDVDAIEDFVEDLRKCLQARVDGEQRSHFFGGIVCSRLNVPDSSSPSYEIIDGQQRISSFVMLAAAIIYSMRSISDEIQSQGTCDQNEKTLNYLSQTILRIQSLYLNYSEVIDLDHKDFPKLTLSKADNTFFQSILFGNEPAIERPSHERIKTAWEHLKRFIETELEIVQSVSGKAAKLQSLIQYVLAVDCTVIFMWSESRSEAYRIFQVMNDRGIGLADGDLLRARTLELLDYEAVSVIQDALAERWDSALAYPPTVIDKYLLWYFASHEGRRLKKSEVTDRFMDSRFREPLISKPITGDQATKVLAEVKQLDEEFVILNQLNNGEWPYHVGSSVKLWDVKRLAFLVRQLKHTNVMPLLMALRLLEPKQFAEAVASLERFVFRYKTIGNAHISPATKVYYEQATVIRENPKSFKISNLRRALGELIKTYTSGERFRTAISELTYSNRRGNGNISYLLIAIEDYLQWCRDGAKGTPTCKDKMRVLDISNTTLEHIYPQNPNVADQKSELEEVKHTLGNLTILSLEENDAVGNEPFNEKRAAFRNSNLRLNRDIAKSKEWTKAEIDVRTNQLALAADKIFVP